MKSTTASLLITALASTAIAQPHGHHQHQHQHPARAAHQHHHKRALVTEWDTVWVTETVTELIDDTTTEWFTPTHSASTPSTTLATVTAASSSPDGGEFFEGSSAAPSSTPKVVAPPPAVETPSLPYVAPAPAPTTTSSSSTPVYVAPQPTVAAAEPPAPVAPQVEPPAPVAPQVEPTTSAAPSVAPVQAPAAPADPGVSTNTNAASILGSGFKTGDLTYYTVGLGACGEDDSGQDMTSNIVAMSSATMGSQSNGNPMCGKTIKIFNSANGKTATGVIRDKCPGCAAGSIDVSQKLFEELADLAAGRIDISWNWAS
ncbi:hypothetical protein diail_5301 [Diaporthe ilicicola]|nr:hypothetical protein diail_5301 [Diaporthe ilicicola]